MGSYIEWSFPIQLKIHWFNHFKSQPKCWTVNQLIRKILFKVIWLLNCVLNLKIRMIWRLCYDNIKLFRISSFWWDKYNDVTVHDHFWKLNIVHRKINQYIQGNEVLISKGNTLACPVSIFRDYVPLSKLWVPIFIFSDPFIGIRVLPNVLFKTNI